jgi:hypothetical protein
MSIQTVRIITILTLPSLSLVLMRSGWTSTDRLPSAVPSFSLCMYIQEKKTTQTACKKRWGVLLLIVGHLSCVITGVRVVDDDDDDDRDGSIFK